MAEVDYQRRSVKDIRAGLDLGQVGRAPVTAKPSRPIVPKRAITANIPATSSLSNGQTNLPQGDDNVQVKTLYINRTESAANKKISPLLLGYLLEDPRRTTQILQPYLSVGPRLTI